MLLLGYSHDGFSSPSWLEDEQLDECLVTERLRADR
jgi:hypothetical protein